MLKKIVRPQIVDYLHPSPRPLSLYHFHIPSLIYDPLHLPLHTVTMHPSHVFQEDVALNNLIGMDSYRFSISWSRVLPSKPPAPTPHPPFPYSPIPQPPPPPLTPEPPAPSTLSCIPIPYSQSSYPNPIPKFQPLQP